MPDSFWRPNEIGVRGGIEYAFMSTTRNRKVAMDYATQSQAAGTIFEIQMGMVDRGVGFLRRWLIRLLSVGCRWCDPTLLRLHLAGWHAPLLVLQNERLRIPFAFPVHRVPPLASGLEPV